VGWRGDRRKGWKYYVLKYENRKMRPVEIVQEWG
jgi:hypothetical protein